jgi:hypothetical protein
MILQSNITKNILKVYDYLESNKLIKNKTEFCNRVGYDIFSFSKVQTGERDFPENKIHSFIMAFYVNINFVLTGKGKMFYIERPITQIAVKNVALASVKNKLIVQYTSLENITSTIEFVMN